MTDAPELPLSWPAVPGPANRVTFLDEQAARRTQARRFTAVAALSAAIVGLPLAMFLTPAAYLLVVLGLRMVPRAMVPDATWNAVRDLARFVPALLDALGDAPDDTVGLWLRTAFSSVDYPFGSPVLAVAAMILPGMGLMVLIWLGYRALFRVAGVGGSLLALGAREPRPDDFEERQLANVVEEIAVAAGLRPPAVRIVDASVPNAAAIGSSADDAVVVISRGLLDRMDRDETQGVIAHVVGSIGSGDLGIALSITTVFQSIELVFTALDACFNLSPSAWRSLFWMLRLVVSGGHDRRAAETIATMLDHQLGEMREDGITAVLSETDREKPRHWAARVLKRLPMLYVVVMPFLVFHLIALFLRMQVSMFRLTIVGPLLMRVWRTRRLLADATAVELTRNPQGLANALHRLAEEGGVVPGGQWFAHLFVIGPEAGQGRHDAGLVARLRTARSDVGGTAAAVRAAAEHAADERRTRSWAKELAGVSSHPSIPQRVHRLVALGATDATEQDRGVRRMPRVARGMRFGLAGGLLGVLFAPLIALAAVLMVFAMSAIFMFGFVAALFFMGIAMAGIHALLT
jgi:Zn-dependent protease with chaperone function